MTLTLSDNDSTSERNTQHLEFWQWQLVGGPMGALTGRTTAVMTVNDVVDIATGEELQWFSGTDADGNDGDNDGGFDDRGN